MISYITYDIIDDVIYAKLTLTSHKLTVLTHSDRVSESRIMISYMISYTKHYENSARNGSAMILDMILSMISY